MALKSRNFCVERRPPLLRGKKERKVFAQWPVRHFLLGGVRNRRCDEAANCAPIAYGREAHRLLLNGFVIDDEATKESLIETDEGLDQLDRAFAAREVRAWRCAADRVGFARSEGRCDLPWLASQART